MFNVYIYVNKRSITQEFNGRFTLLPAINRQRGRYNYLVQVCEIRGSTYPIYPAESIRKGRKDSRKCIALKLVVNMCEKSVWNDGGRNGIPDGWCS